MRTAIPTPEAIRIVFHSFKITLALIDVGLFEIVLGESLLVTEVVSSVFSVVVAFVVIDSV